MRDMGVKALLFGFVARNTQIKVEMCIKVRARVHEGTQIDIISSYNHTKIQNIHPQMTYMHLNGYVHIRIHQSNS